VILSLSARQVWALVCFNLLLLTGLLGLVEVSVDFFMSTPVLIPSEILLNAARTIYWKERDKDLIQFSRDCAQYHEQLAYTLRPGTCHFAGPEFSNTYHVNSLGLRDDENSLHAPEVIVIGDSQAMGWGVEQQETFAQILEARTGLTVLNAAVSSYGTAREISSLKRLDTGRLRFLVIQYSNNDSVENKVFYLKKNRLDIMARSDYESIVNAQETMVPHIFGRNLKHISRLGMELAEGEIDWLTSAVSRRLGISRATDFVAQPVNSIAQLNSAELFLNVLMHSGVNLSGIEIIVFEISTYGRNSRFLSLLQKSLLSKDRGSESLTIKVIDVAKLLGPQHYYRLDGHLNAEGHRVMADAIIKQMGMLPKPGGEQTH